MFRSYYLGVSSVWVWEHHLFVESTHFGRITRHQLGCAHCLLQISSAGTWLSHFVFGAVEANLPPATDTVIFPATCQVSVGHSKLATKGGCQYMGLSLREHSLEQCQDLSVLVWSFARGEEGEQIRFG